MHTNLPEQRNAASRGRSDRDAENAGTRSLREVERARIVFLARRFGLSSTRAVIVAALAFGESAR